jgi:hypothetical protein
MGAIWSIDNMGCAVGPGQGVPLLNERRPRGGPFTGARFAAVAQRVHRHASNCRVLQIGRKIQELAGHQDLGTTQRYMHLSPAALESAITLLEGPQASARVER